MVVVALLGAGLGTAAGAHYTIRTRNFVDPTGPRFAGCCATEPERSELRLYYREAARENVVYMIRSTDAAQSK